MIWSTSAYIYLVFCIFNIAISVRSNNTKIDDKDADIDPTKVLLSFYTCNDTNLTSINCLIQDLNCIEQAYNLISEDKRETTVFIHGYHSINEPMLNVISAFCSQNTSTFALLDWTRLQPEGDFNISTAFLTPKIGKIAANTFNKLKSKGYNVETWHLIGFSMGVHIASCIAKYTNLSWLHITGLDPAGIIFYTDMYNDCQINPDVANLTDIFYTDGNGYGTIKEVGTLHIYANAGVAPQPGCCSSPDIRWCGHFKAMEWYSDAVRNETRYPLTKCPNCFMNLRFNEYCQNTNSIYLGPHIDKEANDTNLTSTDCLIQDLNCIEQAYNLTSEDKRETTVFIHGYHSINEPMLNVISAFCSQNTSTFALLDWTQFQPEDHLINISTIFLTPGLGKIAANTFDKLKSKGYNVETWHLIGFSMGAHIVGCIAKYTNFSWLHITGLDPAGAIYYTDIYKGCAINPSVANLTDIFYTDGNGYGTIKEVGTLNIYANAGVAPQPGCCSSPDIPWCGHFKAMEWYSDAVRNETRYPLTKCPNCFMNLRFNEYCQNTNSIYLGPHIDKEATGTYCLAVN